MGPDIGSNFQFCDNELWLLYITATSLYGLCTRTAVYNVVDLSHIYTVGSVADVELA